MSVTCCPLKSGEGYGPSFHSVKHPVARRAHRCYECWRQIAPGEKYEKVVGLWDGEFSSYATCVLCSEIRDHFACGGFVYGQLWDDPRGNFISGMTAGGPCMTGLSPAAKERLFEEKLKSLGISAESGAQDISDV